MKALPLVLLFTLLNVTAWGQPNNRKAAAAERLRNRQLVAETDRVLAETQATRLVSYTKLRDLRQNIAQRNALVVATNQEINFLETEIAENEQILVALEADRAKLKKHYAETVYETAKTRNSLARLSFLFASGSFNQAAARLRYLNQAAQTRRNQVDQINEVLQALEKRRYRLEAARLEKKQLLRTQQAEAVQLASLREQEKAVVDNLKKRPTELKSEIANRQKANGQIVQQLTGLNQTATTGTGAKVDTKRPSKAPSLMANPKVAQNQPIGQPEAIADPLAVGGDLSTSRERTGAVVDLPVIRPSGLGGRMAIGSTPEGNSLAPSFAQGKAQLPWPVKEGVITGHFGTHEHPVFAKVMVDNLGIDIRTPRDEAVRPVYGGKVAAVSRVSGMGYVIMVQHGEFFTVYGRLASTNVKQGQMVTPADELGTVGLNDDGYAELQFQIWRNQHKLNPEEWLAR
ncbi:MAG: peptidoglycan DD-metalloendopeptidase family protein [Bernardetiaceae bacterium]|jgi:septal ring factor EnvC (AmiA/AmiB activator)|nr:peptidoglycan DD-metalloendopeptidase family protein [Bernardetiaceae bacterium]